MSSSLGLPSHASKTSRRGDSQTLKTNSFKLTSSPLLLSAYSSQFATSEMDYTGETFTVLEPQLHISSSSPVKPSQNQLVSLTGLRLPLVFLDLFSTTLVVSSRCLDWVKAEFSDTQRPGGPVRLYGGRAIASVNTVMWFYNLFGLLLPVFLPRSCEIYFSADNKGD